MIRLAWRLARRELRGGFAGFRVFLACLALGVAAIAGAGSLNAALRAAMQGDARALLGGDLVARFIHQPAAPLEMAALERSGEVSLAIEMRAMALLESGDRRTLVELKAVDDAYPLFGQVALAPEQPLAAALARRDGAWGAAVDANLLSRLGLTLGDSVRVGDAAFVLRATIEREPDRVASVFALGPRLMVHADALAATGLVQPGSLIRYYHRLRLSGPGDAEAAADRLRREVPDAAWQIRTAADAAPSLRRFLDNMTLFLTLVGLTTLLVGGIGVANAVRAFVDGRVPTIATLKCLGATAGLIFRVYLLQVGVMTLAGIAIGLTVGALLPLVLAGLPLGALPIVARAGVYPQPLLLAAAFGVLTALAFGLWPLARAGAVAPGALFRERVAGLSGRLPWRPLAATAAAVLALAGLAVGTAHHRMLAAGFVLGAALALLLFRAAAALVRRLAKAASRRPRLHAGRPVLRLGLANLHRPGAPTTSAVLSLGLGLSVLVAVTLVEVNLSHQVGERLPEEAPAFFFLDIQQRQAEAFDAAVAAVPGAGAIERAAMVRGRIVRIKGVPVGEAEIGPEAEWAVRGDRGLTTRAAPPESSRVVAGAWWPEGYEGPPLLSVDARVARGLDLDVGDTLTLNVLGREITAEVASLREIDWSAMAMNFALVLSPGALAGAPHAYVATVHAGPEAEDAVERAVVERLPNVSAIRVRQALESVRDMMRGAALALRAAAAVTLAAGALVLAGAVAAGHRRRVYEAVMLKVLGARRADLTRAFVVEYGLLGLATGAVAAAIGSAAAWAVLVLAMRAEHVPLPGHAAAVAGLGVAVVLGLGFAGTWRALGRRTAPLLRDE